MKYFFIAGETSGDQIAGAIVTELLLLDSANSFYAWGGPSLLQNGATILKDTTTMQVMGFSAVAKQIWQFYQLLTDCKKDIEHTEPDVIVLVDYGGFNLKIAKWAHQKDYKIIYVSPPKTWASRNGRNKIIRQAVDHLIVLYPFEHEYFKDQKMSVSYHGHPLHLQRSIKQLNPKVKSILLAPGSRKEELKHILPIMLNCTQVYPTIKWTISIAPGIDIEFIKNLLTTTSIDIELSTEPFQKLCATHDLLIVTSGTASIEAAWIGIPQIVVYKTTWLNYQIAKRLIKVPYLSLVNLQANTMVAPELIQDDLTVDKLSQQIDLLSNLSSRSAQVEQYKKLEMLMFSERHSFKIAKTIYDISL